MVVTKRPGTTNSKYEPHVLCRVLRQASPVDLTELQDLLDLVEGTTLLTRRPKPEGNGHDHAEGEPRPSEGPVEVEAELAAMAEGKSVNAAQIRIIPSLLRKGEHPDDVLKLVVNETMARVGDRLQWSRTVEVHAVIKRILSAYKNLLLKDYDPATGIIPDWLPGEFHPRHLSKGAVPTLVTTAAAFTCGRMD